MHRSPLAIVGLCCHRSNMVRQCSWKYSNFPYITNNALGLFLSERANAISTVAIREQSNMTTMMITGFDEGTEVKWVDDLHDFQTGVVRAKFYDSGQYEVDF